MSSTDDYLPRILKMSIRIRDAAEALTLAITEVENALSKLPGRTDTVILAGSQAIRLHRSGKTWILSYGNNTTDNWLPVVKAPLKIKIEVAHLLPQLLERMAVSQTQLVADLESATASCNSFTQLLQLGCQA